MNAIRRVPIVFLIFCSALIVSGCAANQARVEKGGNFATAGIAYVDGLPAVFDESFELSVAANTHQLLLGRDVLTEDDRERELAESDELLEERLSLLRDLRRHSLLLRSYFISLKALTSNDNATGINSAADGVIASLAKLRPGIEDKTIGDAKVSELIGPVVSLVVGAYQNSALKNELAARGPVIERELALQKEVINALVDDMTDNAQLIIQIEQLNPIFEEYVTAANVSAYWNNKRVAAYKQTVSLETYDDIKKAAANMHSAWTALVERRESEGSLNLLIEDIEQFLAVVRKFKSND